MQVTKKDLEIRANNLQDRLLEVEEELELTLNSCRELKELKDFYQDAYENLKEEYGSLVNMGTETTEREHGCFCGNGCCHSEDDDDDDFDEDAYVDLDYDDDDENPYPESEDGDDVQSDRTYIMLIKFVDGETWTFRVETGWYIDANALHVTCVPNDDYPMDIFSVNLSHVSAIASLDDWSDE